MATNGYEKTIPLSQTVKFIVDNRGKTAPTAPTGIALIATNCVTNDHLYPLREKLRFVSQETYDTWFRAHPQPGDILLTNKGSQNGAICLVPDPVDFVIAQDMVALRPNEEVIDPHYLFAALRSPDVQQQIKNLDVSGVIPHFKKTDFDKLLLPYPDRHRQQTIGRLYLEMCSKIEVNRRLNETLESIASATFMSWFVQANCPAGWHRVKLVDVCEYIMSGGTPSTKVTAYWNGNIPWLSSGETRSHFICGTDKKITQAGVENSSVRFARRGCTVIASAGQGHTRGQTSLLMINSYINQSVIALAADHGVISDLYLYFDLQRRYEEFRRISDSQSSRGSLTTKLLANLDVVVPPRELVTAFDDIAKPLVERARTSLEETSTLVSLRDMLLPKLLTGEIRLQATEQTVGRAT